MNHLISSIFILLSKMGYIGVMLGLMIEIIPSEVVLAYAGYLVSKGEISFIGAIIAGTIGGTAAQLFLYWIGMHGGRPFLTKFGRFLLISERHLTLAESWFERYGAGVIFTARFIPVVRHAISIPAGIARMSFWKFTLLTAGAIIPWSMLFIYLGKKLGPHWKEAQNSAGPYLQIVLAAAVAGMIIYLIIVSMKARKSNR